MLEQSPLVEHSVISITKRNGSKSNIYHITKFSSHVEMYKILLKPTNAVSILANVRCTFPPYSTRVTDSTWFYFEFINSHNNLKEICISDSILENLFEFLARLGKMYLPQVQSLPSCFPKFVQCFFALFTSCDPKASTNSGYLCR